ncbi:MAG: SGNH/GDSL hydrolase family protein [Actinomycetota bacterium]|nr:SGNH/GDSL hydrolase family protein [Actinomycetota bacterium]
MALRLVCVGDSFTEGMCDETRPDGHYRGWADRVAHALAGREAARGGQVEYANLAIRGKLLDQVVAEQLDLSVSYAPDIATFHAGPNDVLRPRTDLAGLCARYAAAASRMADGSGRLVLFTSIGRTGGEGRFARRIADRFARFNDNVRTVAAATGALVVDLEPAEALTDRRLWWTDRLHLNAAGHARVAAAVLERLGVDDPGLLGGEPGWWREPLPPRPPVRRRDALAQDAAWVTTHLLPWIGRRLRGVSSGDGREPKDPRPRLLAP